MKSKINTQVHTIMCAATMFVFRSIVFAAVITIQNGELTEATPMGPNITFAFGTVNCVDVESHTDKTLLYAYYGIPYAMPPVKELRLKPPKEYNGTDEFKIVSHHTYRNSCIQFPETEPMDEDCLHLNVFVPSNIQPGGVHCHVIFYIHGGGYTTGSARGAAPTDLVAQHDVIVVTANYRLGFLGFLSTNDEVAPGNSGLRDLIMALKWVKTNIWKFGGNNSDITVVGHGSGGTAASLLALSPEANGLFNKVVMMSGTAVAPTAIVSKERTLENLYTLAKAMGCYPWYCPFLCYGNYLNYHGNMIECMQQKDAMEFSPLAIQEADINTGRFFGVFEDLYAGPICDGIFLPNDPEKLLKNLTYLEENGVASRSYISGSTNEEGAGAVRGAMNGHAEDFLTSQVMRTAAEDAAKFIFPLCTSPEVVNLIDFVYSYPRETGPGPELSNYVDLVTDSLYTYPSVEFLTLLSQTSVNTKTYMYLFNVYPDVKTNNTSGNQTSCCGEYNDEDVRGTEHGQDLLYLLDRLVTVNDTQGHIDLDTVDARSVISVYRGALAEFAKTGSPSVSGAEWPSFDASDREYLSIEPQPISEKRIYRKRISLWQDYLPKVVENLPEWG